MQVENKPGLDPTLPDVVLTLGGVDRHLVYDHNAIVVAEKLTGINLFKSILGDVDATQLRALLFASLIHEDPDLTLEDVGGMIRPYNVGTIHSAILAAWLGSVVGEDKESEPASKSKKKTKV